MIVGPLYGHQSAFRSDEGIACLINYWYVENYKRMEGKAV